MGVIYTQEGLGVRVGRSWVTTALVAVNVIVYLLTSWENSLLEISERWLWWGGFVPAYLADPRQAYRLLTSMFLHANLIHIFFNMLYLYNFGKLVEQALGSKRYLALYFLSGLAAELFHTAFIPVEGPVSAVIPAIGASGAISGVLGAYLLLFPGSKLSMCFFYLYFPVCVTWSAAAYLIFWFVGQVLQGYAGASAGVAVFAHAGGFLGGVALLPYVLDRERHSVLRALTASQRAFKYLFLGSAGLGRLGKLVLAVTIAAVAAGGVYSAVAARQLSVPIKILAFSVSYKLYEPGGNLIGRGYESEAVVLRVERGPSLAAPIASSSVRIVYNRLEAAGVLYDRALAGTAKAITLKRTVIVQRVPVNVNLSMEASYDEDGFLDSAKGVMYTTVLVYDSSRGVYVPSGEGEFSFEVGTLAALKREGGPLSLAVAALAFVAVAICAVSLDNVLRKSGELEILA
jgi:membrane associated rhomboid family serine protease